MTIEEAITHLQEARWYPVAYTEEEQEAYEMAFAALRAQQEPVAKLNKSWWEGCDWCGHLDEKPCHACAIKYDHWNCGEGHPHFTMLPYKYCPECGRPLTEDAWAELERRIGGNDGTAD